jgi:HEAT repeat protein
MALATIDSYLEQIDELVRHAADHDDLQFRLLLEELVKKGGRDTENAIGHYITGTYISIPTCMNLIRMAGYIRSAAFLVPLNKVIELSKESRLREAAIISVSKYNDRRALDILDRALEKNKNKQLEESIAQAIARIKYNNPLLAMLPRFLHGSKNRELFQITLKVFKKILGPADAKSFISYLHHGDQIVAEGSFEILCFRGDEAVFFFVAEFFREQSRLLVREAEHKEGAERLLTLIAALHEYLKRHRDFFPQLRPDIAALLGRAGGSDWGKVLTALLVDLENGSGAP